ncbi:MAG: ferredoxin [Clostridiales bacterium]|nr:MAG: ferredoxin [Clostridiales bacterium]
MEKVTLTINGIQVQAPKDYTILKAAREIGIHIPTLCYLEGVNEIGACRVCVVEVERARALLTACTTPVAEGMVVKTNSKRVREARKMVVELILANHNRECLVCDRNGSCELQKLTEELGIKEVSYEGVKRTPTIDDFSPSIVRDTSKCILCGRCIATCKNVQEIGILEFTNRGFNTEVSPAFNSSMTEMPCIYCGQCVNACPVAALREKSSIDDVWEAIDNPDLHVIVQSAPAVRAALGECFDNPIGTNVTGKMATALHMMGFDKVFDTNFAADLTILEEGTELLGRIKNGGVLPMITSCSPGWINFAELNYPELLPHLSSCKSPHQMFGAIMKTHYAKMNNIDPKKIYVVSVMPCTAKKYECKREEMGRDGYLDVDTVITTRELGKMIKQASIDFNELAEGKFDEYYGDYSGAAVIFGATGGVMEAALRTVADVLTGKDLEAIEYKAVRGEERIREAEVQIGDLTVKAAVTHSAAGARKIMEMIKAGEADYHFIEIMGCDGGCVNGGGQPHVSATNRVGIDIRLERAKALYSEDESLEIRKSHKNPSITRLYEEFLGEPNSHVAHEVLHTHYAGRDKYNLKK